MSASPKIARRALVAGASAGLLSAGLARGQAAPRTLELGSATILQLAAAMASGALTTERLLRLYLARIARYDPALHAVMAINPKAVQIARALDAERKAKGPRSPMHGIPVILKDNIDTVDMPTTGGSFVLAGSIPPADAVIVKRLRGAGAIILAKVNMSEFAAGGPYSSIFGQTHNPYNDGYIPGGSSGGAGVGIAAAFASLGLGTDTGGSVRGPSTINGIVGLKPTKGLLSMAGVIPLALTFDSPGPMARSVTDVAVALGVMAGPDPADPATAAARGHVEADYAKFLRADALKGARIGLVRNFTGNDPDYDWVIDSAASLIREAGAEVADVTFPKWLMDLKGPLYTQVRWPEFKPQMDAYLATLKPGYPKTLEELAERSRALRSPGPEGYTPNASRWSLFKTELSSGTMTDSAYLVARDYGLPLVSRALQGILDDGRLDAFLYLTTSVHPPRLGALTPPSTSASFGGTDWATQFASLTGFPDLVVPAGFTSDGLPVGVSFMGRPFSEPRLLALGYAFEQAAMARRPPPSTPALPGETIRY